MSLKLLLADDSATIAKILGMALQSEAYSIKAVATADEAIKELKENKPFFFLVDLTLPAKNGYDFTKMIRANAKLSDIRVVLLSSAFDPIDLNLFQECGADLFIEKPFDPADLRLKLQQLANQPPKFPEGTNVQGVITGTAVQTKTDLNVKSPAPAATLGSEVPSIDSLLSSAQQSQDANSILESLLHPETNNEAPPPFAAPASAAMPTRETTNPSMATIRLDKNSEAPPPLRTPPQEPVLDLSSEFESKTTMLDTGGSDDVALMGSPQALEPMDEPLSANALALAEFFAAEIENKKAESALTKTHEVPAPAPMSVPTPPSESLAGWSRSAEPAPARRASPAPAPAASGGRSSSGASMAASPMFDTGGSNFRFAADYIDRITQAYTGDLSESTPARPKTTSLFPSVSDDRAPPAEVTNKLGGGAWSQADLQKIEGIVREEVQMVVREVVEKVAWEIIPELAENLIRKELDKVMKELEET